MELQALSGVPGQVGSRYTDEWGNIWEQVDGLSGLADPNAEYRTDELGNIFQKIGGAISQAAKFVGSKVGQAATAVGQGVSNAATWVGKAAKVAVTTPYRLGLLAYMKLNVGGQAALLRFAYAPYGEIHGRFGIGPKAYAAIKLSAKRLRDQFTNLGGDANTLKMAILTGNGNRNRDVSSSADDLSGLGSLLMAYDADWQALSHINHLTDPIPQVEGLDGIKGLAGSTSQDKPSSGELIKLVAALVGKLLQLLKAVKTNDPADPVPARYRFEEDDEEEESADELEGISALKDQIVQRCLQKRHY